MVKKPVLVDSWWILVTLFCTLLQIQEGSPTKENEYMIFLKTNTSRNYIHLEGKYSYSATLILQKDDKEVRPAPLEFVIQGPEYPYYGLMAVINKLYFRPKPDTKYLSHSSEVDDPGNFCLDYIQFHEDDTARTSPKVCGILKGTSTDYEPYELIGPRTFYSSKGRIRLQAFVAYDDETEEPLGVLGAEIVFTAYSACPNSEAGLKTLVPCTEEKVISCIPSALFCDSKIDCGFEDGFAIDEEQCYFSYLYAFITIIILLLVAIAIYGFISWIKWKSTEGRTS